MYENPGFQERGKGLTGMLGGGLRKMSWEEKEVVTTYFLTLNCLGTSPGQRGVGEEIDGWVDG